MTTPPEPAPSTHTIPPMPNHELQNVTVYCSSSYRLHEDYFTIARRIGEGLARTGRTLVYGGGKLGMMGVCAKSCRDAGGHVVGIITTYLAEAEQMDPENHENIVVQTMNERKRLLEDRADAIIILPGGVGTLEEFFAVFVAKLVGEHEKPIIIANVPDPDDPSSRYYDPLIAMLEHVITSSFAKPAIMELVHICDSTDQVIQTLDRLDQSPSTQLGDRRRFMPGLPDPAQPHQDSAPR